MDTKQGLIGRLSEEVPIINSNVGLNLQHNGNAYDSINSKLSHANSSKMEAETSIDMGEECPLIHSELQWKVPRHLSVGRRPSVSPNSRRNLGTIGGVSSPIALAMFSTFLFLRAGNHRYCI